MDAAEIAEWMAFYRIEPWGEELTDTRWALLTALIYNANRGSGPPKGVDQFQMVRDPEERPPLTAERIREALAMSGARVVKEDG